MVIFYFSKEIGQKSEFGQKNEFGQKSEAGSKFTDFSNFSKPPENKPKTNTFAGGSGGFNNNFDFNSFGDMSFNNTNNNPKTTTNQAPVQTPANDFANFDAQPFGGSPQRNEIPQKSKGFFSL